MTRIFHIVVREYLENVRTRAFLIGIVLTPLWFALAFLIPSLAERQEISAQRVVLLDATGTLGPPLRAVLATEQTREGDPAYAVEEHPSEGAWDPGPGGLRPVDVLRTRAGEGELLLVVLTPSVLRKESGEPEGGVYCATSLAATRTAERIKAHVNRLVNERIMEERGIDPEDARTLARDALKAVPVDRSGREGSVAQAITPLVFMMFLFMGIVGSSQMLISNTIEEKASRIYEVLLSSVSPFQLMAGKILGICAVGLTLMLLWSGGGLAALSLKGLGGLVTGQQLGLFLAYYLLGFFLIASLMVAVGSACNTLKEAQNLMAPISLLLAMPLLLAMVVMSNPNGGFATAASFVPPFTPFLMMARIAAVPGPPAWQILASLLLLVVSTYLAVRLAARVFRVGILMYGQPPRLKEIWRWMRAAD